MALSESNKVLASGGFYYKKLETFIKHHFERGEKYIEFINFSCVESTEDHSPCDFCSENQWVGSPRERVPCPMPHYEVLPKYHYKHVSETSRFKDGSLRETDDFQPRKNIKLAFEKEHLSADNDKQVNTFCNKFTVDKSLVVKHLIHLKALEALKIKRKERRVAIAQKEASREYKDYDWFNLIESKDSEKLKVPVLDKYLFEHNMKDHMKLRKPEKLELIKNHILRRKLETKKKQMEANNCYANDGLNEDDMSDNEIDGDDDEDDDEVLACVYESSSEDGDDSDEEVPLQTDDCLDELFTKTRSGRIAGTWRISNFY